MKVLSVLFERLIPPSGGGTPRTQALIRAMRRRGHEVYITCGSDLESTRTRDLLGVDGHRALFDVDRLDGNKMLKYLFCHPLNIRRTVQYARQIRPDVIVAHNSVAGLAALEVRRRLRGVRVVLDLTDLLFDYLDSYRSGPDGNNGHDSTPARLGARRGPGWLGFVGSVGRRLERRVVRESDLIITMSETMRGILYGMGAQASRTVVVPDGVDLQRFRPMDGEDLRRSISPWAESVVVFHGVVDPQDEPLLLVDAAREIVKRHPRTAFWVVGDGSALETMKRRVVRMGLSRSFHFTGWVPASLVSRYVAAADLGLVLLPDIRSARGRLTLKGFECWAVGIPVVAPDLPGLAEVLRHAEAAATYEAGNAMSLADRVADLLADPDRRERLGRGGRQMVCEHYDWSKLGREMVSHVEETIGIHMPERAATGDHGRRHVLDEVAAGEGSAVS